MRSTGCVIHLDETTDKEETVKYSEGMNISLDHDIKILR